MKKFIKIAALILALILLYTFNNTVITKQYNANTLYGSLKQKLRRAESLAEQEKFIIIGGSSSNLGFDSQLFEELSGKPAVNLSVSGAVPLRVYMKAAAQYAAPGDVILMPLEYAYYAEDFYTVDEAYADVVAVEPSLKCETTLWGEVEYYAASFLRSFTRLNDCVMFTLKNKLQISNTIYIADSVDEYGDFCLHQGREPTYTREPLELSFSFLDDTMRQIRKFVMTMEEKGVKVYLSYPAYDLHAIEGYGAYSSEAQKVLNFYIPEGHIIGTPETFAYDEDCFFDTAYHIRYEQRARYTEDLFRAYQVTAGTN